MKRILILGLLMGLGGCTASRVMPPGPATPTAPETGGLHRALTPDQLKQLEVQTGDYRLGAGDAIEVYCMNAAELNRKYVLGPDGKMTLPGIGVVSLDGLTREQAAERIETLLQPAYLSPVVNLMVLEYNNNRVSVLGEVRWPGQYNFPGRPLLLDALARAQGLTDRADMRGCTVIRGNGMLIEIDLYDLLRKGDRTLNIPLLPEDAVFVRAEEGHTFYVLGEVARPGVFPRGQDVDVVRAIAGAGGETRDAQLDSVRIVRRGENGQPTVLRVDMKRILEGRSTETPPIITGDIVYVPRRGIASFNYYLNQVTPSLNLILLGATLEAMQQNRAK
jgi:polysaccharide export outer membrane protein